MKISELIKEVTKEYMPLYKEVKQTQKEGNQVNEKDAQRLFELSTKLELFKILKSSFMETIVKDEKGKVTKYFVDNNIVTFHKEKATDKNGKEVEVDVVNESMDTRIDMLSDEFTQPIIEKMVTSHKMNITGYENSGNIDALKKEKYELEVLESFLPKEATKEDILSWLNENYPNGISMKEMGPTIGKVKKAFDRVDGKMVSEVVKSIIS
jgi:hypothetical protein